MGDRTTSALYPAHLVDILSQQVLMQREELGRAGLELFLDGRWESGPPVASLASWRACMSMRDDRRGRFDIKIVDFECAGQGDTIL